MDISEGEIRKIKRMNYGIFCFFLFFILCIPVSLWFYQEEHRFTTEKWLSEPEERTRIVDDLLREYNLIGMNEYEIRSLLGEHNNEYGYFNEENRYVYCLGPERGLFSIDSEWLILDFSGNCVSSCSIVRD